MTEAELLEQLANVRLPLWFATFTVRDALLAVSLGMIAGLIITFLLRGIFAPTLRPAEQVEAKIKDLARVDLDARLLGLAILLQRYAPDDLKEISASYGLYDPARKPDPLRIEAAIRAAVKGRNP